MTKKGYKSPTKDTKPPEKPPQPPQQPHACTCSRQQRRCFWYNPDSDSCDITRPHPTGCGPNCTDYFIWGKHQSAVQQQSQPRPFVRVCETIIYLDDFSAFDIYFRPDRASVRGLDILGHWTTLLEFSVLPDGIGLAHGALDTIQAAIERWNQVMAEPELGGLERLHTAIDEYERRKVIRNGETLVSLACDSCEGAEVAWVANSPTGTRSVYWICQECEKTSNRLIEVGVSSGP